MPMPTLADRLEYQRLEHRARRMQMVLDALEDRTVLRHPDPGSAPTPLMLAIRDFTAELGIVRRRMAELRSRTERAAVRA